MIAATLQVIMLTSAIAAGNVECEGSLDRFLACNNARVIEYLSGLTQKDLGRTLEGVLLTNGERQLDGAVFLGKTAKLGKGSHVYIFKYMNRTMAYLWIDKDGSELSLPKCSHKDSLESAYVLTGDVYTYVFRGASKSMRDRGACFGKSR